MRRMERKRQEAKKGEFVNLIWLEPVKGQIWSAPMPRELAEEACADLLAAGYKAKVE